MAVFTTLAAGLGLLNSATTAIKSARRAREARNQARAQEREIARLEASRQEIIDPTIGITELGSMITNPFANLQVATGAAEFAAEQQDLSLASTLDTLRATGAGAGGATALAQAATRGRQQIAADIQRQEAENARLRAQGEQRAEMLRMQDAQRVQEARAAGQEFLYSARDKREIEQLERADARLAQFRTTEAGSRRAATGQLASFMGGLGGAAQSLDALASGESTKGLDFDFDSFLSTK